MILTKLLYLKSFYDFRAIVKFAFEQVKQNSSRGNKKQQFQILYIYERRENDQNQVY